MEQKYDTANAIEVYKLFKNAKDDDEVNRLDVYLKSFEKTMEAWTITQAILMRTDLESFILLQAARAFKHKIEYDFAQLPQNEYVNQINLLVGHIKRIGLKNESVLTQLILAFVFLYMRLFETWGSMSEFLQTQFAKEPDGDLIILKILKELPDEASSDRIVIDDKQREQYIAFLKDKMETDVLVILDHFGKLKDQLSKSLNKEALKVFRNWMNFSTDKLILKKLLNNSMLKLSFEALKNSDFNSVASEAIKNILEQAQMGAECPQELYENFLLEMINQFPNCDEAISNHEYEDAMGYIDVFVKFGKVFLKRFIYGFHENTTKFLLYLIKITSNNQFDNFDELTDFWTRFSSELSLIEDQSTKAQAINMFKDLFLELIKICSERSRMSDEHLIFLNENLDEEDDKIETFECKNEERSASKYLMKEIRITFGFKDPFIRLCELLKKDIEILNQKTETRYWAQFESRVYLMSYLVSNLENNDIEYLADMFQVILKLPISFIRLKNTIAAIIGKGAKFVAKIDSLMPEMFKFLASNLADPKTVDYSSKAVCDLCSYNGKFIREHISDFFDLYVKMKQDKQILIGLVSAISGFDSNQKKKECLETLCRPLALILIENLKILEQNPPKFNSEPIENALEKLAIVAKELPSLKKDEREHPFAEVFEQLWPVIVVFFDKFQDNLDVIEMLCKLCKNTMRCILLLFKPFAVKFFEIVTNNYSKHIISSYVYAAEVCVTVFSETSEFDEYLRKMFDFMCEKTYNHVNNPKEYPELIEDFFGMLTRYMRYKPVAVIDSASLLINLKFAGLTIGMEHFGAAKCVYSFIEMIFKCCSPKKIDQKLAEGLSYILSSQGFTESFVAKLIAAVLNSPPGDVRDYIFDCFYAATKYYKEPFLQAFRKFIVEVPQDVLIDSEKAAFVKIIYNTQPNDLGDLKDFCAHFGQRSKHRAVRV